MKYSFTGGVHPLDNKKQVEDKKTELFPASKFYYIPLLQHIGSPCKAIVGIGEKIKSGQKIAENDSPMSSPVHSPVSGKVTEIKTIAGVENVIIENDYKNDIFLYEPVEKYKSLSGAELVKIIRERGIVGLGGATFPTHIKLKTPDSVKIKTFIVNGAECEPYLNSDNRIMQENGAELVEGIKIILHMLGAEEAVIGIENNKPKAIENMKKLVENETNIKLAVLKTKYPQGGEKQLIKAVTGKVLPVKKLPLELGIVVSNVHTVKSVYDGVVKGVPLTNRLITVSGKGIAEPKNLWVNIGTKFSEILEYTGFDENKTEKLIVGGPLMGVEQSSTEVSVTKGTTGILALSKTELRREEKENCISCGKCVDVCPIKLMPLMFERNLESGKFDKNEEYNLSDCIECGACTYICPSNRPLNEAIRTGKIKLREKK